MHRQHAPLMLGMGTLTMPLRTMPLRPHTLPPNLHLGSNPSLLVLGLHLPPLEVILLSTVPLLLVLAALLLNLEPHLLHMELPARLASRSDPRLHVPQSQLGRDARVRCRAKCLAVKRVFLHLRGEAQMEKECHPLWT